jgi:hypothetical protein
VSTEPKTSAAPNLDRVLEAAPGVRHACVDSDAVRDAVALDIAAIEERHALELKDARIQSLVDAMIAISGYGSVLAAIRRLAAMADTAKKLLRSTRPGPVAASQPADQEPKS